MTQQIFCQKLKKQADALKKPPYPGELGQQIYEHISKEAWQQWLAQQTMLINEYRLVPLEPKDRAFLEKSMREFLFEDGDVKPAGYI